MQHLNTLLTDVITLLAPITRDRYTYTGKAANVDHVNPTGIDLHVDDARTIALDDDGTAHPYMILRPEAGSDRHTRLSRGRSLTVWGFQLDVAAGSPHAARSAITLATATLARARPNTNTGILTPYFDQVSLLVDDSASPPRWYAPLRYTTSVHGPTHAP